MRRLLIAYDLHSHLHSGGMMFDFFKRRNKQSEVYGSADARAPHVLKTSFQSALESSLSAVAIAFANRNYDAPYNEFDIVAKATDMAECIMRVTAHRMVFSIDHPKEEYRSEMFFGKKTTPEIIVDQPQIDKAESDDDVIVYSNGLNWSDTNSLRDHG
ncbi:MAG: hypothetical protein FGM22_07435 [Burkholderiaceae bacterium]|nr:hypothetical protein [Burkholderiaceae bacterium]